MKYPVLILLLTGLLQAASAQRTDLNFINFSSKDGLSSNSVNAILKDRYGYMWFATDDGITKFDGVNFAVYRHNPNDSNSIGPGSVMAMLQDRSGNLWMGTGQGLSRYVREKDIFSNIKCIGQHAIRSRCEDHHGNIWVGSYEGLFVFDPHTGKIRTYQPDSARAGSLASNVIICLFEDSHNRMWVGTIAGLQQYTEGSDEFRLFRHSPKDSLSIPDNIIRTIAEDGKGNIWIGTNDGGLSMLRQDGKNFRTFRHIDSDINSLSSDRVYTIAVEGTGKLWLGTEDGLNIFDPQTGKTVRIADDQRNKYSLNGKSIRSIYIGKDGIYWIGALLGGVNKYDKNLAFFNLRESNPFDPYGLKSPNVTSFAEDPADDVYIGTDGGGLNLYHRATGLFDHIPLSSTYKEAEQSILDMERVGD